MKNLQIKEAALKGAAIAVAEKAKDAAARAQILKIAKYLCDEGAVSARATIAGLGPVTVFPDGHVEAVTYH